MVKGFSKLSKKDKIDWLVKNFLNNDSSTKDILSQYWNKDAELQSLHDEFSENTLSNYYMPFGVAPNFIINGEEYVLPMAIEESSVVAAASNAAKYWATRGGFTTEILGVEKLGHVHFTFSGASEKLKRFFNDDLKETLLKETEEITKNMQKRGGGILSLQLKDKTDVLENYFQIEAAFNTVDSMGANFINSCLEQFAKTFEKEVDASTLFTPEEKESLQIIMCILSNYTPQCMVRAKVSCKIEELAEKNIDPQEFADKFYTAVNIARIEPYRATTHNKGIMNGVDAVIIATGNDFRAVEACAHTYAARDGQYRSLSYCKVENGQFTFWLDLPLSLGTVGGLTNLHPLVKVALQLLKNPSAQELMGIVAVAGLAQNFGALRSLVTTGIQKGHMKMHLYNILNQLGATEKERDYFTIYFKDKTVSYSAVITEFKRIRNEA